MPTLPPFARSFVAVMAGMVVAVTVVSIGDLVAGTFHPLPAGFDMGDMAQVRAHAAAAPLSAMLIVLAGWILGPFAGGLVASRVAARSRRQYAWIIAGVLLAATLANLRALPHPAWMVVGALIGVPAAGWSAARLAPRDEA
ncbi:MAG: hypothetical protein K8S21_11840 [Gemmatimonadetes bacterium]|nr:hypothetical protein [Gemmatimonadota bacterium]